MAQLSTLNVIRVLRPLAAAEREQKYSLIFSSPGQRTAHLTPKKRLSFPAFYSLAVMAVDSMLRGENRAQAGIQRLHDQALVGAGRSRVGIRLGLLP